MADEFFLSRWARLKRESREAPARAEERKDGAAPEPASTVPPPVAGTTPAGAAVEAAEPAPLPPVESLTPESDFSPFMRKDVDPNLRQQALRTLFNDPRFNVMDGLDVYIDDYSKPDPLPPEWLAKLNQVTRLGEYREPDPEAAQPAAEAAPAVSNGVSPAPGSSVESDTSDARDEAPDWGDRPPADGAGDVFSGVHSTAKETHEVRAETGVDQSRGAHPRTTRGGRRHE